MTSVNSMPFSLLLIVSQLPFLVVVFFVPLLFLSAPRTALSYSHLTTSFTWREDNKIVFRGFMPPYSMKKHVALSLPVSLSLLRRDFITRKTRVET